MSHLTSKLTDRRLLQLLAAATFCYWLALLVVMHIPLTLQLKEPDSGVPKDKLVHFVLYAGLSTGLFATLEQRARFRPTSSPRTRLGRAALVFAFCAIHGYVEELTQPLSGRTYDLVDAGADCIGAACALLLGLLVCKWLPARAT